MCIHVFSIHITKHGLAMCTVSSSKDSFSACYSRAFVNTSITGTGPCVLARHTALVMLIPPPALIPSGGFQSFPVTSAILTTVLKLTTVFQPSIDWLSSALLSTHWTIGSLSSSHSGLCCSFHIVVCDPTYLQCRITW